MNEPFLTYGKLRLLNVPGAKPVYDEVLVEDCYRRSHIPKGSLVLDVGGFCGEFGIWCAAENDCDTFIYEPSQFWDIAAFNCALNSKHENFLCVFQNAIAKANELRCFEYSAEHPVGSRLADSGIPVESFNIRSQIDRLIGVSKKIAPLCVKLDCEGAEREIFEDESWLSYVHMVLMEFHNKDGQHYKSILEKHGFSVEFNDPNPEAWRATIYAQRK